MKLLVQEGLVKFIGLSEPTADQIRLADQVEPKEVKLASVELAYSLFTRRAEVNGVLRVCRELNINIVAYTSLVRGATDTRLQGLLADDALAQLSDEALQQRAFELMDVDEQDKARRSVGFFEARYIRKNLKCILAFQLQAAKLNVTPTQLALAWLAHQDAIAIPGTISQAHLKQNADVMTLNIAPAALDNLSNLFPPGCFVGDPNPSATGPFNNRSLEVFSQNDNSHRDMNMITVTLQNNRFARDYAEEISTAYLTARAIHTAIEMELVKHVPHDGGIDIQELIKCYPAYIPQAVEVLIAYLCARGIFKMEGQSVCHTILSETMQSQASTLLLGGDEWLKTYDVLDYVTKHHERYREIYEEPGCLFPFSSHSITLASDAPLAILRQLSNLHIMARTLRWFCECHVFDELSSVQAMTTAELVKFIGLSTPEKIKALGILLAGLRCYHFLAYDEASQRYSLTEHSRVLCKAAPDSLYPAMLTIDRPWWDCASRMHDGLHKGSASAFELHNRKGFYSEYVENKSSPFHAGMAALSLMDDTLVAEAVTPILANYTTVIDIGAGFGGLLFQLSQKSSSKSYILFEKNVPANENHAKAVGDKHPGFAPTIVLGDFTQNSSGIPRHDNALYIMKCCLHNEMDQARVVTTLKNIRCAMGANSRFLLAERILPANHKLPHINRGGNLLMRLLFGAPVHDEAFYSSVLTQAGFDCSGPSLDAGNFQVFNATPTVVPLLMAQIGHFSGAGSGAQGSDSSTTDEVTTTRQAAP